jgi:hypothetical protein
VTKKWFFLPILIDRFTWNSKALQILLEGKQAVHINGHKKSFFSLGFHCHPLVNTFFLEGGGRDCLISAAEAKSYRPGLN